MPAERLQAKKGGGLLRTQLEMDAREDVMFKEYCNTSTSAGDVTFNVQDFGAIVYLCRQVGADVLIHMDKPASPLVAEAVWPSGANVDNGGARQGDRARRGDGAAQHAAQHVRAELFLATAVESLAVRPEHPGKRTPC